MTVLGLGHDVVDMESFRRQCLSPGSLFVARAFCQAERLQCKARAQASGDDELMHLAARWAGKEAVLKAWCEALGEADYPLGLDGFEWSGIRIVEDARHRPHVEFSASMGESVAGSLGKVRGNGTVRGDDAAHEGGDGLVCGVGEKSGNGDGAALHWHVSLSHDGLIASAIALVECIGNASL